MITFQVSYNTLSRELITKEKHILVVEKIQESHKIEWKLSFIINE